jgi:pimeloyl-ACP methyl ester carboxylesterase
MSVKVTMPVYFYWGEDDYRLQQAVTALDMLAELSRTLPNIPAKAHLVSWESGRPVHLRLKKPHRSLGRHTSLKS